MFAFARQSTERRTTSTISRVLRSVANMQQK